MSTSNNSSKDATVPKVPTPIPETAPKPTKDFKSKGEIDPFWLEKVFPDSLAAFEFESPTPADLSTKCVFALDTNILLAPYEVGSESFHEIEPIYNALASDNRLFVPAQAAREYAKVRGGKVSAVYQTIQERLSILPATKELKCPILEEMPEYIAVNRILDELRPKCNELKKALGALSDALMNWGWKDKVSSLYRSLFVQKRIIEHGKTRDEILTDLAYRHSHSLPPGYKDASKMDGGIGDLLIWWSLIALAKQATSPVVFVCNDEKPDWSIRGADTAILPRTELTFEFNRETGQKLAVINWKRFLKLMHAKPETLAEASTARSPHRSGLSFNIVVDSLVELDLIFDEYLHDLRSDRREDVNITDPRFHKIMRELKEANMRARKRGLRRANRLGLEPFLDILKSIDTDRAEIAHCVACMKGPILALRERMHANIIAYKKYLKLYIDADGSANFILAT